jgi:hypothetical protein
LLLIKGSSVNEKTGPAAREPLNNSVFAAKFARESQLAENYRQKSARGRAGVEMRPLS